MRPEGLSSSRGRAYDGPLSLAGNNLPNLAHHPPPLALPRPAASPLPTPHVQDMKVRQQRAGSLEKDPVAGWLFKQLNTLMYGPEEEREGVLATPQVCGGCHVRGRVP